MRESILEWNLDKKLLSVVVDNASANNSMIKKLKDWLVPCDLIDLNGDLLHVRCSAHILNFVVQDGLSQTRGLLEKIRETSRYLKKSPAAAQKFDSALDECNLKDKRQVAMDVPNRWNSTFELLETTLPLREAFCRLERIDKYYLFNPSESEWEVATYIHKCLHNFCVATSHFSDSKYPTSNVFFSDICKIYLEMIECEHSEYDFNRHMAGAMKIKFDKYWDKCCLVLAVAVVFDPRYKMSLVKFYYTRIYGSSADQYITRVRDTLKDLFFTYGGSCVSSAGDTTNASSSIINRSTKHPDYETWYDNEHGLVNQKSEWEAYLDKPRYPSIENFSILDWWRTNSPRLPILAKIARDILVVPATTVASEEAFSVGGRIIDESRASLHPDAVEAIVVADD